MTTIHKYPIKITGYQKIMVPRDAKVIHAGLDPQGFPCIWATVNTQNEPEAVVILVYGTGWDIDYKLSKHVSSFMQEKFMWHVFVS